MLVMILDKLFQDKIIGHGLRVFSFIISSIYYFISYYIVHHIISSIVNEVIETLFCLFIYFLRKISATQKTQNEQFSPLMKFLYAKNSCLCCFLFACFCFFSWFCLLCVFRVAEIFRKKNRQTKKCLDNLIYYSTDVHPPQPNYGELFSTDLAPVTTLTYFYFSALIVPSVCTYFYL